MNLLTEKRNRLASEESERNQVHDRPHKTEPVRPSLVDPSTASSFTLDQELEPFGRWTTKPIWVPPKDSSDELADSMFRNTGVFASKSDRWKAVLANHRDNFTQVRQIEMTKASIRLPKGRIYVTVTEQQNFDQITDEIPACVQTRLDEFMAGPGSKRGVKVYYLKPLCVEIDDELYFTSERDLRNAIEQVREETERVYQKAFLMRRGKQVLTSATDKALALPRHIIRQAINRREKAINDYQAKLEFQRRKTALRAAKTHKKFRTDGCTYDEMLALTNPLQRTDVAKQYGIEMNLSAAKREQLIHMAAGQLPWFAALSMGIGYIGSIATMVAIGYIPPVAACDPAFVAEFPNSNGTVMKIGHFDEIAGVKHIEL
ncbi:hypothetical protein LOC67_25450 [Stieleria sp. JC731]|nr:hypothetical protein [Stieleria sp. JC731]MCC9603912.1 hypothetical protein [Stieleria sp. JC731]